MSEENHSSNTDYWRANLKWVGILLTIWFMVDFMVAEETLRVKECQMYPTSRSGEYV